MQPKTMLDICLAWIGVDVACVTTCSCVHLTTLQLLSGLWQLLWLWRPSLLHVPMMHRVLLHHGCPIPVSWNIWTWAVSRRCDLP